MNLRGSFQYRATRLRKDHAKDKMLIERTIVMQARNVKFDLCPRPDRESCLSALSIAHGQCCIFCGHLRDTMYLIDTTHGQVQILHVQQTYCRAVGV